MATLPAASPEVHEDRDRGFVAASLILLAVAHLTDYRVRAGVSALVPELAAYLAIGLLLYARRASPFGAGSRRLWFAFAVLTALMVARAFWFRIERPADSESSFSRARDIEVPLLFAILCFDRMRLSDRALRAVEIGVLATGVVSGAIGLSQFLFGRPFLFDSDVVDTIWKTRYAQKYWMAEVLHLQVKQLARGLQGYAIGYAITQVVPCLLAFAWLFHRSLSRRIIGGLAFLVIYAGIYVSFSRTVAAVVPFACLLVVLAVRGRLPPALLLVIVIGYALVAYIGPVLQLTLTDDVQINTLTDRARSLLAYGSHVRRDPAVFFVGSTIDGYLQWESTLPHNWIVYSALRDGVPATLLRLGVYVALFAALFPVRARRRTPPLSAGLWVGGFAVMWIIGQTEPFSSVGEHLLVCFALGLVAVAREPARPEAVAEASAG